MKVGAIGCCLQVDKTAAQGKEWDLLYFNMLEGCVTVLDSCPCASGINEVRASQLAQA